MADKPLRVCLIVHAQHHYLLTSTSTTNLPVRGPEKAFNGCKHCLLLYHLGLTLVNDRSLVVSIPHCVILCAVSLRKLGIVMRMPKIYYKRGEIPGILRNTWQSFK